MTATTTTVPTVPTAPAVDIAELLTLLKADAISFTGKISETIKEDGTKTVKIPKMDTQLYILGEKRNALKITAENLVLAFGALTLYIRNNPDAVVSESHAVQYAETAIAVCAATARILSEKAGYAREKADVTDKIVKSAAGGLVSYFDDKAGKMIDASSTPPTEGASAEQTQEGAGV